MAFPKDCVEGTQNSEVPGRDRRTGFSRATEFSCVAAVTGDVNQLDRI